jgi:hypothetical protein
MITTNDRPALATAHFWRWLAGVAVVFAIADFAANRLALALLRPGFDVFHILAMAISSIVPWVIYALTFFLNLHILHRFDEVAGDPRWVRLVAGVGAAIAVAALGLVLAATLRYLPFLLAFHYFPILLSPPFGLPLSYETGAAVLGALCGAALGLLHRFGGVHTGRAPGLTRPHLWGGVIAGLVLAVPISAPALLRSNLTMELIRSPLFRALMALPPLLAFLPHAILTWRAMLPALAPRSAMFTTTGQFLMRLATVVIPLAALAVAAL